MNVCGLGLGSLKQRVTLERLLNSIPIFAETRIQEAKVQSTRADYEDIKREHAKYHKQLYKEQQRRKKDGD